MNWLTYSFVLITAYLGVFAESTFLSTRALGAQVDLLPGLIVFAGLTFSFGGVMSLALIAGLFFDTLSANPLGTAVLPLLIIGGFVYRKQEFLWRQHPLSQFVLGCAASAFAPVCSALLLMVSGQQPIFGLVTIWQVLVMALGGGLVTPVWFWIFGRLNDALRYPTESEFTFREDREIERGRH